MKARNLLLAFIICVGISLCWSDNAEAKQELLPLYYNTETKEWGGSKFETITIFAGADLIEICSTSVQQTSPKKVYEHKDFLTDQITGFSADASLKPGLIADTMHIGLYRWDGYSPITESFEVRADSNGLYVQSVANNYSDFFDSSCISMVSGGNLIFKDANGDGMPDIILKPGVHLGVPIAYSMTIEKMPITPNNVTLTPYRSKRLYVNINIPESLTRGAPLAYLVQAAAEAAATAAAEASATATAVAESAKALNAPLITQFQVNGGELEKEGTDTVKAIFRAQNSPIDASWDKIQYRITRVDSTGIETELVNWTNFDEMLSSRGEADIQPIAGMNNLILYVKNTTSGAISKANTTLIAGTISDRVIALESYFGGMYRITKESRDYSGYAAIMADEAKEYALDAYSTVTNSTYGLSALKSLIDTVNGVADQAQAAAEKAEAKALNAYNAVETGTGIKTIDVLTDPTANKGLIQTYDKADTAATNASTAASRVWDAAEGKSAATLAKEARDKVNEVSRRAEIKSVKGKNGATCTTTNQFTVVITANNATSYRARVAGESTWYISTGGSGANTWGPGNEITVRNISGSGPITIQVAARYSNDVYETTDSITIFKIVQ